MESLSTEKNKIDRRPVIGFSREMNSLEQWVADPSGDLRLFAVSGIGGIGKTTLLTEMFRKAKQASLLALWLDGQSELTTSGAFLSSLEMGLQNEYGRFRGPDVPLLPYLVAELSKQRSVLVMDNCERFDLIEGWLLSNFLPRLKDAGVLLVIASRNGLPVKWRTNPLLDGRMQTFPLKLFSREEIHEYLRDSGLEEAVQKEIAQKTEGLPLLLAMIVDLQRSREGDIREIPSMLSAEFLKEVASPSLFQALTVLSLLPAADQPAINNLLDDPLTASGYFELGKLSFIRSTPYGLSLHHVVARLLREEHARRNPSQFQQQQLHVFKLLAEQFRLADKRRQMQIAAHVLELYREFLPAAHAYADFSSTLKPQEHSPYRAEDLPDLQRFLAWSISNSDWQSELVEPQKYHELLETIATDHPEGIYVVRDSEGIPLAFCAGFWLHAGTIPLLERYAPRLSSMLGEEAPELLSLPAEASDTICVLLAAVNIRHPLYRPEELGALLMRQWLIFMTRGFKGINITADPHLNSLFSLLGFKETGRIKPEGLAESEGLTRWELDFRQAAFEEWVQKVIRQTGPADHAPNGPMPGAGQDLSVTIDGKAVKQILERLYDTEQLERIPAVHALHLPAAVLQKNVLDLLTSASPAYPLTKLEQQILRESFLRKEWNKNELAARFHMSRTTFYRHSRTALEHFAHVLSHLV
ncbi:bacterio-opsin activator [Paenibacillus macerans]|uniref:bacterio-opsin activator n=1 Tax=Paenibacillus macerans TaxID=44252 RepID=UPI00203D0A0B|nr:bacterio-opsin activator [Paenibacillus macerans]MCM3702931.1 bacterio-opsin activator [Paenibacillus macerans]